MKLIVFDFDSTLMDGETIEFLAAKAGVEPLVKEITDKAMQGELDFFESLISRVKLLKGLKLEVVNATCASLPLMPGAKETIAELKKRGFFTICFSGGFKNATTPMCEKLGIDVEFSNVLHEKNGVLTGLVGGEMMFSSSKGDMLLRLQKVLNVGYEDTYAVGDGANDLSMFKFAKHKIAFCAKPILKDSATIIIENKDLTEILGRI